MLKYPKEALSLSFCRTLFLTLPLELFVPPSEIEVKKREAEALPKLNITKIDCQWLQVCSYTKLICIQPHYECSITLAVVDLMLLTCLYIFFYAGFK